jgi:hypothetical protein
MDVDDKDSFLASIGSSSLQRRHGLTAAFFSAAVTALLALGAFTHHLIAGMGGLPPLEFLFLAGLLPMLCAGLSGYYFAAALLDPDGDFTPWRAAGRGIITAFAGFGIYCLVAAFGFTVVTAFQRGLLEAAATFFTALGLMSIAGLLLVGWLLVLVGGAGGWLLWRYRAFFGAV